MYRPTRGALVRTHSGKIRGHFVEVLTEYYKSPFTCHLRTSLRRFRFPALSRMFGLMSRRQQNSHAALLILAFSALKRKSLKLFPV